MIIILFITYSAKADTWIDMHLASKHGGNTYNHGSGEQAYNETNLGLGAWTPISPYIEWGIGTYKNSYSKQAFYTGVSFHTTDRAPIGYGVDVGIITGYDIPVIVLPHLRIGNNNVRLKIGVLPAGVGLVTATVGIRF